MMRKNVFTKVIFAVMSFVMAGLTLLGCVGKGGDIDKPVTPPPLSEHVNQLPTAVYEYDDTKDYSVKRPDGVEAKNIFFDDFEQGILNDNWTLCDYGWEEGNNGLSTDNVSYTTDADVVEAEGATGGIVVLKSQGSFAADPTHRKRGSALISKPLFGAGLYEVRMKILPRMGACTAAWTYYNNVYSDPGYTNPQPDTIRYSEIDIEMPSAEHGFLKGLYTAYKYRISGTEVDNVTRRVDNDFPFNDGKWHNYAFEWRTEPGKAIVNWYIDGKLVSSIASHIPQYTAKYWVGNWFPMQWAGNPNFEEAYMYVDYVRITEYDEPNGTVTEVTSGGANNANLARNLGSSALPVNNYISNGKFLIAGNSGSTSALAWQTTGTVSRVTEGNIAYLMFDELSQATQVITAAYPTFKYELTASAQILSGGGKIRVFVDYMAGAIVVGREWMLSMPFDSEELSTKTMDLIVPAGTTAANTPNAIRIRIETEQGTEALIKDLKLTLKN